MNNKKLLKEWADEMLDWYNKEEKLIYDEIIKSDLEINERGFLYPSDLLKLQTEGLNLHTERLYNLMSGKTLFYDFILTYENQIKEGIFDPSEPERMKNVIIGESLPNK